MVTDEEILDAPSEFGGIVHGYRVAGPADLRELSERKNFVGHPPCVCPRENRRADAPGYKYRASDPGQVAPEVSGFRRTGIAASNALEHGIESFFELPIAGRTQRVGSEFADHLGGREGKGLPDSEEVLGGIGNPSRGLSSVLECLANRWRFARATRVHEDDRGGCNAARRKHTDCSAPTERVGDDRSIVEPGISQQPSEVPGVMLKAVRSLRSEMGGVAVAAQVERDRREDTHESLRQGLPHERVLGIAMEHHHRRPSLRPPVDREVAVGTCYDLGVYHSRAGYRTPRGRQGDFSS